jgi:hypothetical protein
MGWSYRRRRGPFSITNGGIGVTQRAGRLSLSSRGRGSFRIAPGLTFRFRWKR